MKFKNWTFESYADVMYLDGPYRPWRNPLGYPPRSEHRYPAPKHEKLLPRNEVIGAGLRVIEAEMEPGFTGTVDPPVSNAVPERTYDPWLAKGLALCTTSK